MANYEKQVEQEATYPIPISLYNCYVQRPDIFTRDVGLEKNDHWGTMYTSGHRVLVASYRGDRTQTAPLRCYAY